MFKEEVIGVSVANEDEIKNLRKNKRQKLFSNVWTALLIVAILIIVPVAYVDLAFTEVYIDGASMAPTLNSNDNFKDFPTLPMGETYVEVGLMNPARRVKQKIDRGHIIVFNRSSNGDIKDLLIKRVIGLPGEELLLKDEGVNKDSVTITKKDSTSFILDESYLTEEHQYTTLTGGNSINITLGENEYYVMGDNRDNSTDSRSFRAINATKIEGKLVMINGYGVKKAHELTDRKYYAPWKWRSY